MKRSIATLLLSATLGVLAAPGATEATTRRMPGLGCTYAYNATTSVRYDGISALNPTAGFVGMICPGDPKTTSTLSLTSTRLYYLKGTNSTLFSCNVNSYNTAGSSWIGSSVYACGTAGGCTSGGTNIGRGYLDFSGSELPPSTPNSLSHAVACLVPNLSGTSYSGVEGYYFNHSNE